MGVDLSSLNFGPGFNVSAASNGGTAVHHCVVEDDASFKCWGGNDYRQLGLGDEAARGNEPGEMGTFLSFVQFVFSAQPTPAPTTDPTADPTEESTTNPTDPPSSAQPSLNPLPLPTMLPSTTMAQQVASTTDGGSGESLFRI